MVASRTGRSADCGDVVLTGQSPLGEVLACPSATELDGIAACLVDVDDEVRRRRLEERDPGKWNLDAQRSFIGWARWHRGHARDPPVPTGGDQVLSRCHDRHVSLWEAIWRFGVPVAVVLGATAAVFGVLSEPPDKFSRPRGLQWTWVGVWLMTAGDAAFGHDITWFERAWKGTTALLVAVAVAVAAWRHHRWRRQVRLADDSPPVVSRRDF